MKGLLVFWALCSLVGNLLAERSPLIQKVTFSSTNFENILIWENGEDAFLGTVYNVQYKRYGEDIWHNKSECQNITQRSCDLTRETEKVGERYYAQVRAIVPDCCVSKWVMSQRFCPREDTHIGELEVKYTPRTQSIKFFIQPPYTPLRDEDNQFLTVEDVFSGFGDIRYEITIFCEKTQQKWVKTENNKEFEISNLESNTNYNGTIYIQYLDKKSQPYMFRVRTLPDNTWLPYLFGIAVFITVLIFATTYYLIYKYVKRHAVKQPASLNFKDIPGFQSLTLTVEHILTPPDLSKPLQIVSEMQPAQKNQHLQGVLAHLKLTHLPETGYQQQERVPSFQTIALPVAQEGAPPTGYAPQAVKSNAPGNTLDDNPLTLTYGICVEGTRSTKKRNSPPDPVARSGSLIESNLGNGQYNAQKPMQTDRGSWGNQSPKERALVLGNAEHTQQLLHQEDLQEGMPQQFPPLLEERVPPATLAERTGNYRKQPEELLPSTLEVGPSVVSEGDHLSSCAQAGSSHSHDHRTGQWLGWGPLAWTDTPWQPPGLQTTYCFQPLVPQPRTSEGVKSEPQTYGGTPDTLNCAQDNGLLTGLFKDLELKLQWDHGPENENAAVY
ncbi:interleukin-22 receptor subunit alpha-1 [Hemicordylus capensis]|uniref:interleukin-22 receptor subunit alpha-1 n=1 Tax=Hemicordylus capensis TaxID=884348 RepID=UPI002302ACB9|nr:interleukin-22 receptor subunit alpha-1 [Hemicordylus capensis]